MSGLCIYHGGCTDGVAAAWAVWKKHSNWTFYPGVYQQEPPMDLIIQASEVVIVDFSYKRPVMEAIAAKARSLTVLDHHKTAQDDLAPLFASGDINKGMFDMERCGALMAWDFFHSPHTRPALLKMIDAQDRWLPARDAPTIMALRSYPHKPEDDTQWAWDELMTVWDGLMTINGLRRLREDGVAIYRYYRARVDETKPHAVVRNIGGFEVPTVNAPYYLASDVAGELAETAKHGIGAVWWQNKDGSVTFSLRSRGDYSVGDLAVNFGGGGHPGAAGFRIDSLADLPEIIDG